jgi:tetratricopeptide (TPR) repeat protein
VESKRDDFGYPSSVHRDDGMVVTAYYEGLKQPGHSGPGDYRMCVVIWDPKQTREQPAYTKTKVMTTIQRARRIAADESRLDEAIELIESNVERKDVEPEVRIDTQRALAEMLFRKDKSAAIEAYRKILSMPGCTRDDAIGALYEIANLQHEMEQYDAFIKTADELIGKGHSDHTFNTLYKKAMVLEEREQVDEAVDAFVQYATNEETPPRTASSAYYYAAEICRRHGRAAEAKKYYQACLEIEKGHSRSQENAAKRLKKL